MCQLLDNVNENSRQTIMAMANSRMMMYFTLCMHLAERPVGLILNFLNGYFPETVILSLSLIIIRPLQQRVHQLPGGYGSHILACEAKGQMSNTFTFLPGICMRVRVDRTTDWDQRIISSHLQYSASRCARLRAYASAMSDGRKCPDIGCRATP